MTVKFRTFLIALVLPTVLCVLTNTVFGQSSDQRLPTAVLTNEIKGTITALDVGDPRLTRHFYAFEGVPGDLLITVNSKNLNGDLDIFTAVTFRPLMKIPIYANTILPEVTKSIYLRTRQILILRLEARTPNDDDGSYLVRFRGAFEAFSGGIPVAERTEASTETASSNAGTRRLSSVGATIAVPPTETPAASEPKSSAEKPEKVTTEAKSSPESARTKPARSTPSGRNTRRRPTTPARSKPAAPATESAKSSTQTESGAANKEGEKSSTVSSEKTATAEKPAAQETPAPQPGAHLIIEEKDGTRIDRPMSSVRRVVIEGNVILIVLKTGRIERVPMSAVAKMTIEP